MLLELTLLPVIKVLLNVPGLQAGVASFAGDVTVSKVLMLPMLSRLLVLLVLPV